MKGTEFYTRTYDTAQQFRDDLKRRFNEGWQLHRQHQEPFTKGKIVVTWKKLTD